MNVKDFQHKFGIIGNSRELLDTVDIAMQIAPSDITVLIYGESGVGKEVFARAIHGYSRRKEKQIVSVNCAAIPEGILESELFGHTKGSFTGAIDARKGYFEIADGGTLFLDEIGEMPLTLQVKLLRAIETKEFMRVGAEKVTNVDVRIITATNKDLQQEVEMKRFREDLYFRLKAVTLNIPPLRKRKADIELLINHFVAAFAHANHTTAPVVTDEAMEFLRNYSWPGNVRELKNTVETAITLNRSGVLDVNDFYLLLKQENRETENRNLPVFVNKSSEEVEREIIYRALYEIKKDIIELKDLFTIKNEENYEGKGIKIEPVIPLNQLEREAIINALSFTKGNKRKAAKLLQINERTLYRKLNEYGI